MATLAKGTNQVTKPTSAPKEKEAAKVIDIFNDDFGGEEFETVSVNLEADPFTRLAPVVAGRHRLRLMADRNNQATVVTYNNDKYIAIPFVHVVVSDDKAINGSQVQGKVTTRVGRSGISTCAALLVRLGVDVPKEHTHQELAKLFAKALQKEMEIDGEVDWEAQVGTPIEGTEELTWTTARYHGKPLNTYENFPDSEGGGKEYKVVVKNGKGDEVEVSARAIIRDYYAKKTKAATPVTKVSKPKEEEEEEKPKLKFTPKPPTNNDDDDLD